MISYSTITDFEVYGANNKIVLIGRKVVEVVVYTQLGQQLYLENVTEGVINHTFAKGIYIVKVDGRVTKLLVK